jgi:hypothetical protein
LISLALSDYSPGLHGGLKSIRNHVILARKGLDMSSNALTKMELQKAETVEVEIMNFNRFLYAV